MSHTRPGRARATFL